MTLDDLPYFASPEGQDLLRAASELSVDDLARLTRLRKTYPPDRCRAAVTLLTLRERARTKFSRAADMAFDRDGLEQASGEIIAAHRARRYRGCGRVVDLCCGVGGDTAGLAAVAEVVAVDIAPNRVGMTRWNAAAYGVGDRVRGVCADGSKGLPEADAVFMDPARREGGRRFLALAHYRPPVRLDRLRVVTPHIGVKVAPGIPYSEIPDGCEVEFISESGACKEAVLWFGKLRTDAERRATILPLGETLALRSSAEIPVRPPGGYIYEPDRAVIRAHLVEQVADDLDAWKLSVDVAYLSSDRCADTPFARCYRVIDVLPFNLKKLQRYLSTARIGRLDIKKRRFPLTPEALRSRLKLKGDGYLTLFLTRIADRPTAIVCAP